MRLGMWWSCINLYRLFVRGQKNMNNKLTFKLDQLEHAISNRPFTKMHCALAPKSKELIGLYINYWAAKKNNKNVMIYFKSISSTKFPKYLLWKMSSCFERSGKARGSIGKYKYCFYKNIHWQSNLNTRLEWMFKAVLYVQWKKKYQ